MVDDNYGFRDEDERKAFYIALPVLALFGGLLYYFVFASDPSAALNSNATSTVAFVDTDADGIADHIDQCANEKGTLVNNGCLSLHDKDEPSVGASVGPNVGASVEPNVGPNKVAQPKAQQAVATPPVEEVEVEVEADALNPTTASTAVIAATAPIIEPVIEPVAETVKPVVDPAVELDSDADGIIDTDDACPDTAGADNGCPADTDADGVPDDDDACPDTPGADNGCPADTDADGVPDDEDACPDTPGQNNGCPAAEPTVQPAKDLDADGVADTDDKCPDIAGSPENAGCPASTTIALTPEQPVTESEEKLIQDAGFNIQFNAGNSVLTGRSLEILLEVAKVLQRYPDISLEAHGFTDDQGSAATNKNLSLQRAQSCIDVIVEAGIDKSRLKALGFGEERPIASNSTAVGRQKNRRVEFKLIR